MTKGFKMSNEVQMVLRPRCTHQPGPGNEVTGGQCPFCIAEDDPERALAMLHFFVDTISYGNVHLYAQKIAGPKDLHRFHCGVKNVEFQARFLDFFDEDLLYGCPHCQRLAVM